MKQISIAIFTFIIVSCQQRPAWDEDEKNKISQEVKQTLDNYYRDIRQRGLTAEFNYLDSSADFFWVPPGFSSAISYDSVASILKQNAPNYKSIDNKFEALEIFPLSPDLATYTGRLRSEMTDTSNKKMSFVMVETGLLIRRKQGWKLLNGQTSLLKE